MLIDRAGIAARIPHQGRMCLLDGVLEWDAERIRCCATSHRDPANPLRAEARLGAACGIEYAAQAMALHAALCTPRDPDARPAERLPQGRLASVRDVTLHVPRLDDVADDLDIVATLLSGDPGSALYGFELRAGGRLLVSGRASVLIRPADGATADPATTGPPAATSTEGTIR